MTEPLRDQASQEPDAELRALRERVAAADRALLDALNRRIELVRLVRRHKAEHGIAFVDPGQEQRLLTALAGENPGPLSEPALRELFSYVLALTKREVARAELSWQRPPEDGTL